MKPGYLTTDHPCRDRRLRALMADETVKGPRLLPNVVVRRDSRHMDLGGPGGGHADPGSNYPLGRVLTLARTFSAGHFLRGPA